MGCTGSITLSNVNMNCTDIPRGGMKRLLVANAADVKSAITIGTDNKVSVGTLSAGQVKEFEFSVNDGFSVFEDTKTATLDGMVKAEPVISIEFPKMDAAKREVINAIVTPYANVIAFVEDMAGGHWMVGYQYGLMGSEGKGTIGTGRDQKNVYQLKLTGVEDDLAYALDDTAWTAILAGLTSQSQS